MDFLFPFNSLSHLFTEEEIGVVVKAMKSVAPLTQGRNLKKFEEKFSRYIDTPHSFAVCNATAALEMVAQLVRLREGDEIIIPSHTYTSSAYPFAKRGVDIVWADIDSKTRVLNAKSLIERISPRTKAVVVVHLYGYGADMPEIMEVAKTHKLWVIEDAAQALGVEVMGKRVGSFGDFSVFSFHSAKNITTLGEGGMLVVKDEDIASQVPMLRHNGHCSFPFEREDYWIPAMGNLDFPQLENDFLWPNNFCLGEIECALGDKLLDRIDSINQKKRDRAIMFIDALSNFSELEFHRVHSTRHNYHLLAAKLNGGKRDEFIRKMAIEKKIQCVVQYYPLNRYPLYQKAGFGNADCPQGDDFFDNMVSFPFHHSLSSEELDYILQSTKDVLKELQN
jgi:perosamine synthetase